MKEKRGGEREREEEMSERQRNERGKRGGREEVSEKRRYRELKDNRVCERRM